MWFRLCPSVHRLLLPAHLGSHDQNRRHITLWKKNVVLILFNFSPKLHSDPDGSGLSDRILRRALRFWQHFLLLAKMSTGEPSGSSHGHPLNCQAGPCTNTATTRSLQWREKRHAHTLVGSRDDSQLKRSRNGSRASHQSWGASLSGWSMIRYGTVTLRVVPPGWIWSLRRWSSTSLSRWMPCFFLSSDVTNLVREQEL